MVNLKNLVYRAYLKFGEPEGSWHRRFYRQTVRVVHGRDRIWFNEGKLELTAKPIDSLTGQFSGRANVLLSGPSVRKIDALDRLQDQRLVCVNGSPAVLGDELSNFFLYHINDTGYIRNNPEDFLSYASKAEWTLIDFRAVYLLLKMGIDSIPNTKLIVFDNWAWPWQNAIGEIPDLAKQPHKGEAFLSMDPSLGLANAGTVAFTAAQALWHWGFEEVFFYGLDLNASGRAYHESKPQPQRLEKVFERIIQPAFELLTETTKGEPVRFYNCSPDSRLSESAMKKIDPEASFYLGVSDTKS